MAPSVPSPPPEAVFQPSSINSSPCRHPTRSRRFHGLALEQASAGGRGESRSRRVVAGGAVWGRASTAGGPSIPTATRRSSPCARPLPPRHYRFPHHPLRALGAVLMCVGALINARVRTLSTARLAELVPSSPSSRSHTGGEPRSTSGRLREARAAAVVACFRRYVRVGLMTSERTQWWSGRLEHCYTEGFNLGSNPPLRQFEYDPPRARRLMHSAPSARGGSSGASSLMRPLHQGDAREAESHDWTY